MTEGRAAHFVTCSSEPLSQLVQEVARERWVRAHRAEVGK